MAGMDYRQRKGLVLLALPARPCYKCFPPTDRSPLELSASPPTVVPASSIPVVVAFLFTPAGR